MSLKKDLIDFIASLKNLYRFAMFNYKGSLCCVELEKYLTDIFKNISLINSYQNEKYKFLFNEYDRWKKFFLQKDYFNLAAAINNTYHFLSQIIDMPINEYDFIINENDADIRSVKNNITLILDNIRTPFNVGGFFRNSDAAGVKKIILCGITPTPENNKVKRSAMNTDNFIEWEYCRYTEDALDNILKIKNNALYAVETCSVSKNYFNVSYNTDDEIFFVFGNEEYGVNPVVLTKCSDIISIPMNGIKNSINVNVCCGIILFDCSRKLTS